MAITHIVYKRGIWLGLAIVYLLLVVLIYSAVMYTGKSQVVNHASGGPQQDSKFRFSPDSLEDINKMPRNATLGFGEIIYISLPK